MKDFGREETRAAKAQPELNVAAVVKDTKMLRQIHHRQKEGVGENLHPLFSSKVIFRRKVPGFCCHITSWFSNLYEISLLGT